MKIHIKTKLNRAPISKCIMIGTDETQIEGIGQVSGTIDYFR